MHDEELNRLAEWLEGRLSEEEAAAIERRLADDPTLLNAVLAARAIVPERPRQLDLWRVRTLVARALRESNVRSTGAAWLPTGRLAAAISIAAVVVLCGWAGFHLGEGLAVSSADHDRRVLSVILDDGWGL